MKPVEPARTHTKWKLLKIRVALAALINGFGDNVQTGIES
jgi:hypothetical protein